MSDFDKELTELTHLVASRPTLFEAFKESMRDKEYHDFLCVDGEIPYNAEGDHWDITCPICAEKSQ